MKANQGRVEFKALPYTQYTGKIRLKGNEPPLRFELLQDKTTV